MPIPAVKACERACSEAFRAFTTLYVHFMISCSVHHLLCWATPPGQPPNIYGRITPVAGPLISQMRLRVRMLRFSPNVDSCTSRSPHLLIVITSRTQELSSMYISCHKASNRLTYVMPRDLAVRLPTRSARVIRTSPVPVVSELVTNPAMALPKC